MSKWSALGLCGILLGFPPCTIAQVPALLNYQGRIAVGTTAFEGTGQFKLALVNGNATEIYWLNSGDANNDGEPDAGVSVNVSRGLYSLMIGDTSLANMAALTPDAFVHSGVYLRVWFSDGTGGFERLSPDQRISSTGYSLVSATVNDGAITTPKLSSDLAAQISALTSQVNSLATRLNTVEGPGSTLVSTDSQDANLISKGYTRFSSTPTSDWRNGAQTGVPAARWGHTAIWNGQEMLVWGGYLGSESYSASGGRYHPDQDAWTTISGFGAPSARQSHGAVWTGTELIIWGGLGSSGYLNTGGRYVPTDQLWSPTSSPGAPSARSDQASAWTGNRMIVWGGRGSAGLLADGALYNPALNQWSALSLPGAPEARHSAASVWTGTQFLVWGGTGAGGQLGSGGRLLVDAGGTPQSWQTLATADAPSARSGHSGIWTGQKFIVWGGRDGTSYFGNGGLYDPATDLWTALPSAGAPSARAGHVAVWTGTEMVIFGGEDSGGGLASGAAYDASANKWRTLNTAGGPVARSDSKAVWSGTELLIFGGKTGGQPLASPQRINPQPAWHFYRKL